MRSNRHDFADAKGRNSLALFIALSLICVASSLPGKAEPEQSQLDYKALLEANVDLKIESDNKRQYHSFLLDENGKEIKQLDYDYSMGFSEGLSTVMDCSSMGYIDTTGALVIPIQFPNCGLFSEGLAWAITRSNEIGYIDRSGQQVIKNKILSDGRQFCDGLAAVQVRASTHEVDDGRIKGGDSPGKWGYIDKTGRIAVAAKYLEANDFHEGFAAVRLGTAWLIINHDGNRIGGEYANVGAFAEGLCPVQLNGKCGFIDTNGKIKLEPRFDGAWRFSEGLAKVEVDGKFGFIDATGKLVIAPSYQGADNFSEGLCAVQDSSKMWSFINKKGVVHIAGSFDEANAFASERALVKVRGKFGFIDHAGKYIVEPKYDNAISYSDKRTIAMNKNWNHPIMREALMSAHLTGLKVHKDASSPTGVYIPENLDDALKELDEMLPEAVKEDIKNIKKSDMISYHHGFGTWLRNNWGLWKGLRLAKYMNSIGFHHPDDMSGTILNAYWSKRHGQIEDIAGQAARFKQYWDNLKDKGNSQ